jgi:hypothetical protein
MGRGAARLTAANALTTREHEGGGRRAPSRLEARDAALLDRRHVRQRLQAITAGHRQHFQILVLGLPDRDRFSVLKFNSLTWMWRNGCVGL